MNYRLFRSALKQQHKSIRCYGTKFVSLVPIVWFVACASNRSLEPHDLFYENDSFEKQSVTSTDKRIQLALPPQFEWEHEPIHQSNQAEQTLLAMRSSQGPSYVRIVNLETFSNANDSVERCISKHTSELVRSFKQSNISATEPSLQNETHGSRVIQRLHYSVLLKPKREKANAMLMASWFHVLDHNRCIAIGLMSIIRASNLDITQANAQEIERFENAFDWLVKNVKIMR